MTPKKTQTIVQKRTRAGDDRVLLDSKIIRKIDHIQWLLRVHPEIEKIFKAEEVSISNTWTDSAGNPHQYYIKPRHESPDEVTELEVYVSKSGCYSNYGSNFFKDDGTPNLAVLRTVGIGERTMQFKLRRPYSEETLVKAQRLMKRFIIKLFHEFIKPVTIKAELSIVDII